MLNKATWISASTGALLLAGSIQTTAVAGPVNGSDSMIDANLGWRTHTLFTVGETIGSYTPPGILDGMGAYELDANTVRVLVNHELLNFRGYAYEQDNGSGGTFSMLGARVSYFDIDKATMQVVGAGLAHEKVYTATGAQATDASFQPSILSGFSRFCSSGLFEAEQFGNGRGLAARAYFTGEEDGGFFNPIGGALWSVDPATKSIWALPDLGRGAWENVTVLDTGDANTVAVLLADDSSPFDFDADSNDGDEAAPLFLYVGTKNAAGDFPAKNGLRGGDLYVWVADDANVKTPTQFNGAGTQSGSWVLIDNAQDVGQASEDGSTGYDEYGYPTQGNLWLQAKALGAFGFSRPEDVATNPVNGAECVLASTGVDTYENGVDTFGTIYRVSTDFSDLSCDITIVYDGDADATRALRSPDNLEWADDGMLYIQEDKAENDTLDGEPLFGPMAVNTNEAGIVRMDPSTGANERIAVIDRGVILDGSIATPSDAVDVDAGSAGEWESSGIIDVSSLFGRDLGTLFLINVQAHGIEDQDNFNPTSRINDGDLVEGGQLAFLENVRLGSEYCVAGANSAGDGARIHAAGSRVVADNDFTLFADGLPTQVPGIFLYGTAQSLTPFGGGFLCVGGATERIANPVFSSESGLSSRGFNLFGSDAAAVLPGATLNFQLWYRDPAGAGFNLSNGLQVTFL